MILTSSCQHCAAPIEFEAERVNEFTDCAACGRQTRLLMPKRKQVAALPPSRLRPCGDCGKFISLRAVFCLACGGFNRIPFRLVWPAVCLVLLVSFILETIRALIRFIEGLLVLTCNDKR